MISYHRAKSNTFVSCFANTLPPNKLIAPKKIASDIYWLSVLHFQHYLPQFKSLFRLLIKSHDVSQLVSDENPISTNWEANLL